MGPRTEMKLNLAGRIAISIGVLVFLFVITGFSTIHLAKRLEAGLDQYAGIDAPRERSALYHANQSGRICPPGNNRGGQRRRTAGGDRSSGGAFRGGG